MDEKPDILSALCDLLNDNRVLCTRSDIYRFVEEIAENSAYRAVHKFPAPPGPTGPMGARGETGIPGAPGRDAWDKYSYDKNTEVEAQFFWKGVEFWCPVPRHFYDGLPVGEEMTYGDIGLISTVYGNQIVETMAIFWRRAYELKTDMALFINEEDSCNLRDINLSNSFPALLKGY